MSAEDLAFVTSEVEFSSFIPQALFFKLRCFSGEERLGYCVGHRLFVDGARIPGTRNRIERFVQMRNDRPLFATVAVPKSNESASSFVFKTSDGTTYPTSCQSRCLWVGEPAPPAEEMEKTFAVGQSVAAESAAPQSNLTTADSAMVDPSTAAAAQAASIESAGPKTVASLPTPLPTEAEEIGRDASGQTLDNQQTHEDMTPLSETLTKLLDKAASSLQPPTGSTLSLSEGRVVSCNSSTGSGLIAFEHSDFGPQLAYFSWAAVSRTDYATMQKWASSFAQEVYFDAVCSPCDADGNELNQASRPDKSINWQCSLVWASKWSVPPTGPKLTLPLPMAATICAKAATVTCLTERDGVLELRSNDEFYGRWAHFLRSRVFINGKRIDSLEALSSQLRVGEMVYVDAIDRKYLTEGFCHEDTTLVALLVWKGDKPDEEKFAETARRQLLYKCRVASLAPGIKPVGVRSGLMQIIGGPSATTSNVGEMVHFDRECLSVANESMARADLAHILRLDVNVFSDRIVLVEDPEERSELARLHGGDVKLKATAIWRLRMPSDEHQVLDARDLEYLSKFHLDESGLRKLADGLLPAKAPIKVKVPIPHPTKSAEQMMSAVRTKPPVLNAKLSQLLKPIPDSGQGQSSGGVAECLVRVENWTAIQPRYLTLSRSNISVLGLNLAKADLSYLLRAGEKFTVEVEDVGHLDGEAKYQIAKARIDTVTKTSTDINVANSTWLAERGLNKSILGQLVAGEMAALPYMPIIQTGHKIKVTKLLEPTISAGLPGDGADAFVAVVTKGQGVDVGAEVLVERDVFHVYGTCMAKADLSYCLTPGEEIRCEVIAMPEAYCSKWLSRGWKRRQDLPRYLATHAYVGTRAPYTPGVGYGTSKPKGQQTDNKTGLVNWLCQHRLTQSALSDLTEGRLPPLKNNLGFLESLSKKREVRPEVEFVSAVRGRGPRPRSPPKGVPRERRSRSRSPIRRSPAQPQPHKSHLQNPLLQYASRGPSNPNSGNRERHLAASSTSASIPVLNRYSVCYPSEALKETVAQGRYPQAPLQHFTQQPASIPLLLSSERYPPASAPPAPPVSFDSSASARMAVAATVPRTPSAAFIPNFPSAPSIPTATTAPPDISSANAVLSLAKTLLGRVLTCATPDDAVSKSVVSDDRELRLAKFIHKTLEVCITSFQEKQLTMLVNPMLEEQHSFATATATPAALSLSQQRFNSAGVAHSLAPARGLAGLLGPPTQPAPPPASWQQQFR